MESNIQFNFEEAYNIETTKEAFYPLLKVLLNNPQISEDNFTKILDNYKKSEIFMNLPTLEKRLFELISYLNPNSKSFYSDINRKFIINIINYLLAFRFSKKETNEIKDKVGVKDAKESKNPEQEMINKEINEEDAKVNDDDKNSEKIVINKNAINSESLISVLLNIYNSEKLYKILFSEIPDTINKEEYLDMILLFLPEKDTDKILEIINNYLKKENKKKIQELFQRLFRKIDLKTEKGFQFLKQILFEFIKDKNNIANAIKEIEAKYIVDNKMLRCTQCFDLPCFSLDKDNIINIVYKCEHINFNEGNKLDEIAEYKFKCDCGELFLECNKNYLCSNCKKMFCHLCMFEHFKNCLSIFLIPIYELDMCCSTHYEKNQAYCGLCDINLCKSCIKEHHHFVEDEKDIHLSDEDIKTFKTKIKDYSKNNQIILSCLENIVDKGLYGKDLRFLYFVRNVVGIKCINSAKLFNEFFNKEFQKYYDYLIKEIKNGNYYYLNVLTKMQNYYEEKQQESLSSYNSNIKFLMFVNLYALERNDDVGKITSSNNMKFNLITKCFQAFDDIEAHYLLFDYINKLKLALINIDENNILIKCISSSHKLYQQELLKLIYRSISQNIIAYLIKNYHGYFNKLDLNLQLFADIEKLYKNEHEKFKKFMKDNKNKIDKLLSDKKNSELNIYSNEFYFVKPIKVGNTTITVDELNKILEVLFYIKEQVNITTHLKRTEPDIINLNIAEYKLSKGNPTLNEAKKNLKDLLKSQCKNKSFELNITPSSAFDFLFDSKYKYLINISDNIGMNDKIDNILNKILVDIKNKEIEKDDDEILFQNYSNNIEKLEELKNMFERIEKKNKNVKEPKALNEFFERVDKLLGDKKNGLSFLFNLNENEYKSSVTGENYHFLKICLNHVIKTLLHTIKKKIEKYKSVKENTKILFQSKNEILFLLKNIKNKFKVNIFEKYEKINDPQAISEYVNNSKNIEKKEEEINMKIRDNLGKLVTSNIDWTTNKNCNLSTLLFLKQNNN